MNKEELIRLLESCQVPLNVWGTGEAKTIDHLLEELNSGEVILEKTKNGLLRISSGAGIILYYEEQGIRFFRLREEKQIFNDGRIKVRDIDIAPSEKMKPNEEPLQAAYRALSEELGIKEKIPLIVQPLQIKGPVPSVSFPGLKTKYIMNIFKGFLPSHLYKPEGYKEVQSDKTSYFIWTRVC